MWSCKKELSISEQSRVKISFKFPDIIDLEERWELTMVHGYTEDKMWLSIA
jgi:hypothetical protein